MHRVRRLFPLALVLLFALAACSDPPPDAAATVGDAQVSVEDVALVSRVLRAVDSLQQSACGQVEADGDTPEAACNRVSLGLSLQFRLAEAYAAEHDIAVTDAELDDAAASFDAQFGRRAARGRAHHERLERRGVPPGPAFLAPAAGGRPRPGARRAGRGRPAAGLRGQRGRPHDPAGRPHPGGDRGGGPDDPRPGHGARIDPRATSWRSPSRSRSIRAPPRTAARSRRPRRRSSSPSSPRPRWRSRPARSASPSRRSSAGT